MTDHSQSTVSVNVAAGETITMSDTYRYRLCISNISTGSSTYLPFGLNGARTTIKS